ncbi:MAG: asparagine--tRNA ligase [Clostridia bacterium]
MNFKEKILNKNLYDNINEYSEKEVMICGWIRNLRDSKSVAFIELNDGSYFKSVQVIIEDNISNFKEIISLNIGASVIVKGTLKLTPNAKQPFEIKANQVEISGLSTPDYPLQNKKHSMEFLRENAHLRSRTNTFLAIFKVRSILANEIHNFFANNDFTYIHTPIITESDCEGAGEMFRVTNLPAGELDISKDFFGKQANLTVSGQLIAECMAMAFGNVYTFGPTFRAEDSNTTRHAAEFWMIEPEMAFADLSSNMELAENMLKTVITNIMKKCPLEMKFFNEFYDKGLIERLNNIVNSEFGKVTYTKAVELLIPHNDKFEYKVEWGIDLQTEHERYLTEVIYKKPLFVIDYPKDIKAFYMKQNSDNKTVAAMDLLVPGIGEIIGGSQREENLEKLENRMDEMGLKKEDYSWYLDTRRYGTCPHAGFGLGFERLIMYITGIPNIRDVIPFPRTVGNLKY